VRFCVETMPDAFLEMRNLSTPKVWPAFSRLLAKNWFK